MIFHEKLNLKFDVDAMRDKIPSLYQLGDRVLQGSTQEFGGWSLQSDTGDWRGGFEQGGIYEKPITDGSYGAKPNHEYNKRTQACTGIFADVLDELEDRGFFPHRARITALEPGDATDWHRDESEDKYCVRIHIPITTNPECVFTVRDEGFVHMPADGHAHLIDASTMHKASNNGTTTRMHLLAQVWVTGYSEHFIVNQSRKDVSAFYNMKGYYTYLKVLSEQTRGR